MFRGNELSVPRGETGIDPGDRLLIVASAERMARAELHDPAQELLDHLVVVLSTQLLTTSRIMELLTIAKLDTVFEIFDSEETAIASFPNS